MWRTVPGFSDYQISRSGIVRNRLTGRRLKHFFIKGYSYVGLYNCDWRKAKMLPIHRLVWESWNGKIPPQLHVNHKNMIKSNNRLSNLELVTPKENISHFWRTIKKFTFSELKRWDERSKRR